MWACAMQPLAPAVHTITRAHREAASPSPSAAASAVGSAPGLDATDAPAAMAAMTSARLRPTSACHSAPGSTTATSARTAACATLTAALGHQQVPTHVRKTSGGVVAPDHDDDAHLDRSALVEAAPQIVAGLPLYSCLCLASQLQRLRSYPLQYCTNFLVCSVSPFVHHLEVPAAAAATIDNALLENVNMLCTLAWHIGAPIQKHHLSPLYRAAPRSGSSPQKHHLSLLYRAAPRSGSSYPETSSFSPLPRSSAQRELLSRNNIFLPSIEQPRAAGAPPPPPPETSPFSPLSSSPRSGSSSRNINFLSSIGQPRAAGAPPNKQPPPSIYRAAPRSGIFPQSSLLPLSIEQPCAAGAPPPQSSLLPLSTEQPRAAGAPPKAASSLYLPSSPAQRELPPKQPPPSL